MVYAALAVAVGLFAVGLRLTGVVSKARAVLSDANRSLQVMRSLDLTDDEKEVRIRAASLGMFVAFFSILTRTAIAIAIPAALVALCIVAQVFRAEEAVSAGMDWRFIIASALFVTAFLVVQR